MREESFGAAEEGPRGFVISGERERILSALAAVVSQTGYEAMTLLDVAIHAGVELEQVERYCPDKETGFLAAYEIAVWQGIERVLAAIATADAFGDRIWAGWGALIDFIVAEPAFASMCIVDVLDVGPVGIERRNTTWRGFAAVIDQIAEESLPADRPRPPELYVAVVLGGITEIFRAHLAEGRLRDLRRALPALHYAIVVPYLGHAAARAEYERRERQVS
jgi:AcrR family transcriptional regulator